MDLPIEYIKRIDIKMLTQEQIAFLDKNTQGDWEFNERSGEVSIRGDFICVDQGLENFKDIQFKEVDGYFDCSHNKLTSLKGAPIRVGRYFHCDNNNLIDLKFSPKNCGDFSCTYNKLKTLEGAPETVGAFHCNNNELSNLIGSPIIVSGNFNCTNNYFSDLKGQPELIEGNFLISKGSTLKNLDPTKIISYIALLDTKTKLHMDLNWRLGKTFDKKMEEKLNLKNYIKIFINQIYK